MCSKVFNAPAGEDDLVQTKENRKGNEKKKKNKVKDFLVFSLPPYGEAWDAMTSTLGGKCTGGRGQEEFFQNEA